MWDNLLKAMPTVVPWLALLMSAVTGFFAIKGFLLSKKIQSELKSDEVLIPGMLHNPSLLDPHHENCVIQATIFNKSKRKAFISKVQVFNANGEEIEVTWSDRIDQYGNPQGRSQMIGIIDSTSLCIRRNDGNAIRSAHVEVTHSCDPKPLVLLYEMETGWQSYFAR